MYWNCISEKMQFVSQILTLIIWQTCNKQDSRLLHHLCTVDLFENKARNEQLGKIIITCESQEMSKPSGPDTHFLTVSLLSGYVELLQFYRSFTVWGNLYTYSLMYVCVKEKINPTVNIQSCMLSPVKKHYFLLNLRGTFSSRYYSTRN